MISICPSNNLYNLMKQLIIAAMALMGPTLSTDAQVEGPTM